MAVENDNTFDQKAYEVGRMDDKIGLLKAYLPDFLVVHKSIYSILSLGIHELKEQDCLDHFGAIKASVEIILDEKIENLNKKKRIEEAGHKIQIINNKLKSK
jgi:hypothetical protein